MTRMERDDGYILGSSEGETGRLVRQADLYEAETRRLFRDAGVHDGMRVLDVGSGAGDVAFIAADLVGPTGSVLGIDVDPGVLAIARERATQQHRGNVRFIDGDAIDAEVGSGFDAAVGRFVLMHAPDPVALLAAVCGRVRPGGVIAVAEGDLTMGMGFAQDHPSELIRAIWAWSAETFRRAGIPVTMAPMLVHAFAAAGLGIPQMSLYAPLGARPDWPGFDVDADTLASMAPLLEKLGIVTQDELDAATLAERYRTETARTGYPFLMLPIVTAWAIKP